MSIADDETKAALRRVCDRHAGAIRLGQRLPHEFVHDIFACLPSSIFRSVTIPAIGTNNHGVALEIGPTLNGYLTFAAEYCLSLRHQYPQSPCAEVA